MNSCSCLATKAMLDDELEHALPLVDREQPFHHRPQLGLQNRLLELLVRYRRMSPATSSSMTRCSSALRSAAPRATVFSTMFCPGYRRQPSSSTSPLARKRAISSAIPRGAAMCGQSLARIGLEVSDVHRSRWARQPPARRCPGARWPGQVTFSTTHYGATRHATDGCKAPRLSGSGGLDGGSYIACAGTECDIDATFAEMLWDDPALLLAESTRRAPRESVGRRSPWGLNLEVVAGFHREQKDFRSGLINRHDLKRNSAGLAARSSRAEVRDRRRREEDHHDKPTTEDSNRRRQAQQTDPTLRSTRARCSSTS